MPVITYFHLSILLLLTTIINKHIISIVLIFLFLIYYRRQLSFRLVVVFVLAFIFLQVKSNPSEHTKYKVVESKESYAIIQNGIDKVLIYSDELEIGDIVYTRYSPKELQTPSLFHTFDFSLYLKSIGINSYYEQGNIVRIEQGKGFYNYLINKAKTIDEDLYNVISKRKIDSTYSYNVSISYALYQIKRTSKKRKVLLFIVAMICFLMIQQSVSLLMFLLSLMFDLIFEDMRRIDIFGISSIICICIFPLKVKSFDFLLVYILRTISICYQKNKWIKFLILIACFFIFQGSFDLFSIITYTLNSALEVLLYLLSILTVFLPIALPLFKFIVFIYTKTRSITYTIYLAPSLLLISYWIVKLYNILEQQKSTSEFVKLICFTLLFPYLNPIASVEYINVGQGDSTLIVGPFQSYTILIDAAGNVHKDVAQEILIPRLKQLQITKIDYLIITHDDFDHIGSKDSLVENFNVSEVIEDEPKALRTKSFEFVDGLGTYDDSNNSSLVLVGNHYGLRFFFAGDSGVVKEDLFIRLYDYSADILKLSHHGSDTSSSNEFLHQISPRLAIASAGIGNRYNHPSQSVIDDLEKNKIQLLTTADHGSIRVDSFLFFHIVHTSRGEFVIILNR